MTEIKDRIIDSATKCFIRFGYNKTTLDDIGKNVGLKKNSLYHYFKNKDEIFLLVLEIELDKLTAYYLSKVDSKSGIKNKLLYYFSMKLKTCDEQTILHSILTEIWTPNHSLFEKVASLLYGSEIDYMESLLKEAYRKKEIINYDFRKLAESLSKVFSVFKKQEMNNISIGMKKNNSMSIKDKDIIFIIKTLLQAIEIRK